MLTSTTLSSPQVQGQDATEVPSNLLSGPKARTARWRAKHRRLDYSPSADALRVIEHHLAARLDNCMNGVIDQLILAGQHAVAGNASRSSG